MKYSIFIFPCFIFCLFSCEKKFSYENLDFFTIENFGSPICVNLELVEIEDIPLMTWKIIVHDSLLIINSRGSDNLIYVYNLHTGKKINECVEFGSGPGEMLSIEDFIAGDSILLVGCRQDQSVKGFLYSSLIEKEIIAEEQFKYNLYEPAESLAFGFGDTIIGINLALTENRLNFYDTEGRLLYSRGEFPFFGENLSPIETVLGFVGNLCSNIEENRLYLFCKLTDLIEIYDLSGNLIRRLHGPDGFYPNVKQKKWADGASTVSTRESRDAYFEPCVVEDMVFVIYSGAEYENRETKTILVFDKDGNPLKQFKLSENIFTFAADEKSKMIYVSTMEDFEIKRFAYE